MGLPTIAFSSPEGLSRGMMVPKSPLGFSTAFFSYISVNQQLHCQHAQ